MKIYVDKKHIENAVRKDSHHCMIADAIKEQIPDAQYILVDIQSIRLTYPSTKERHLYLTPPEAQWGIIRFDRGVRNIQPFEFELRKPIISKMRSKTGSKKHGKKRKPGSKYIVVKKEREFGIRMYDTRQVKGYPQLRKEADKPIPPKTDLKRNVRSYLGIK